MIPAAQIVDRGRLVLGLLFVVPLVAFIPGGGVVESLTNGVGGSGWLATDAPNPIKAIEDPKDIVSAFTRESVGGTQVIAVGEQSRSDVIAATKAVSDAGEVGSDTASASASDPSPATPPGPIPVAVPSISQYPPPPNTLFVFPVVGGASFTNDWGGERPGGAVHRGVDLFAKEATPVVAEVDSVIFNVGWNDVGGWRYWLRDRWGNEYYHAHLSAFTPAAVEGSQVTAGTVLGFIGNTGDAASSPPHMHYEIHPAGKDAIPPYGYITGWQRVG